MMRKFILFGLLLLFSQAAFAQYNCHALAAVDSIQALYYADGEQIFVRGIDQNKDFKSSAIRLPETQIRSITTALLTIYNDNSLPYWEEIIERYQIHTREEVSSRKIQLLVDTSFLWSKGYQQTSAGFNSGDLGLDRLLHTYSFDLLHPAQYVEIESAPISYLRLDMISSFPLNIKALIKQMKTIKGIVRVQPLIAENTGEFATNIDLQITEEYMEFTFGLSWHCKDGNDCENDHYWVYRVYPDCTAEFVKEHGDVLPLREVPGFLSTGLYPNPTADKVFVQLYGPVDKEIRVILFNALGQIIQSQLVETQSGFIELAFSLKDQPIGMYFLGLISEGKVLTEKIFKR